MPLLDVLLGRDLRNPPEEAEAEGGSAAAGAARAAAAGDGGFRRVLYAYVPCHYLVLLGVCHLLSTHAATMHPLAFAGESPAAQSASASLLLFLFLLLNARGLACSLCLLN